MRIFGKKKAKKYYGLNELDRKVEPYVAFNDGFYVELGANDGLTQSNTAYFEKSRNWRGVLIEPSPNKFLECRRNRSSDNSFYCNACVDFDYKDRYVGMSYANLMTVATDVKGDINEISDHLNQAKKFLKSNEIVFEYGAVARTLNSILKDASAPDLIDLLSLDVEGNELQVLGGVDFSEYNFRYALIECRNIDILENYFKGRNYVLLDRVSQHDYLFKYNG